MDVWQNLLLHVKVAILDVGNNCASAVLVVQKIHHLFKQLLFGKELGHIVVTDDVVGVCAIAIATNGVKVVEAFVPFGVHWVSKSWKHTLQLHKHQNAVYHNALG